MMTEKNTNGRRLLAVFAHPDDESFGPGGTLAHYAAQGTEVHLVCATFGEVGDVPPGLLGKFKDAAELREHELRCAAEHLGLAGVHFMGYRDSGMPGTADNHHPRALAAANPYEVASRVLDYIQQLEPQVVITFDPIGGYRHPDHIAIHKATLKAFELARQKGNGYRPQKLYYHTFSKRWLRFFLRLLPLFGQDPHHFGRNGDIDLTDLAGVDFPIHARIRYAEVADRKQQASECHRSQQDGGPTGLVGMVLRRFDGPETFMRAYPPATSSVRERDLFEGIASTPEQRLPV
jgi:LmbE family N-acetylglucosaminyl deacetylase